VCYIMTDVQCLLTIVESILVRAMISRAPIGANQDSMIRHESFETLGRLCFTQLVDLRHRGAFSTVAQTFAAFCRRCLSANDEVLMVLPEKWYQVCLFDYDIANTADKLGNTSVYSRQSRLYNSEICRNSCPHDQHHGG
jgi:hypothetical protein